MVSLLKESLSEDVKQILVMNVSFLMMNVKDSRLSSVPFRWSLLFYGL